MTNEEIVTRLKIIADHAVHIPGEKPFVMSLDDGIAIHEAIEMLSQQTEDAISRQAVIKEVYKMPNYAFATVDVLEIIEQLPSVTPKQRTGHWIERPEIKTSAPEYLMFYECSECGDKQCFCKPDIHEKHFCINCGARMVEPQESEG